MSESFDHDEFTFRRENRRGVCFTLTREKAECTRVYERGGKFQTEREKKEKETFFKTAGEETNENFGELNAKTIRQEPLR